MGTRAIQLIKICVLTGVASINVILKIVSANGWKLSTMARALYIINCCIMALFHQMYVNKWCVR